MQLKTILHLLLFIILIGNSSCSKKDTTNKESNNTFPLTINFKDDLNGLSTFSKSGVSFSFRSSDVGQPCLEPDSTKISASGGISLAPMTMIVDFSSLDETVKRISVNLFDNCPECTDLRFCDGNTVIRDSIYNDGGRFGEKNLAIDLKNHNTSVFEFSSREAILYSITFE